MNETKYTRKGKTIRTEPVRDEKGRLETPAETEAFASINAAKRKSRELQTKEDGALGRGSVRRAGSRATVPPALGGRHFKSVGG